MPYRCAACSRTHSLESLSFRCPCGGFLEVDGHGMFSREDLARRDRTVWRYREAFGLPAGIQPVSLGEGRTPLVRRHLADGPVSFKLDYLQPSGSFKDRGAGLLLSLVKWLGVPRIVEDSSGNAGCAMAAYAAAAGIGCTIYVPESTPEGKLVQIRLYGAEVVRVPGTRQATNDAAVRAAEGCYYASHLWNPFFVMGVKSTAFEIWEELEGQLPPLVVVPLGAGSNIEGLARGFADLLEAGYARALPRLIGVQADRCPPIHQAFQAGREECLPLEVEATVAEGIAVQRPPRSRAVLEAIRRSGGRTVAVSEAEILQACRQLFALGLYVEPTAAAAFAGWRTLEAAERREALVLLTGTGLKASRKLADLFLAE